MSAFIRAVKQRPAAAPHVARPDSLQGKFGSQPDGRSLWRHEAGDRFDVFSAGTNPSHVRAEAIAVMKEIGIDISGHRSKSVDEFTGQDFDYVITVCDHANEICPVFPGKRSASIGPSKIRPRRGFVPRS